MEKTKTFQKYMQERGVSPKTLDLINQKLKLPNERLTPLAKQHRIEAVNEALEWEKGDNQEKRKITKLYFIGDYVIAVGKPGKEAAPDYKSITHYITGEKTNNPNDMNPQILKLEEKIGKDLTFMDMFERIEKLMHSDLLGLELMGMLLFRAAFMLDHKKDKDGHWRYCPPEEVVELLESRIPKVSEIPTRVFLHFLEVISLNEDIKVYTLGYNDFRKDYGRVNTLLTFVNLIAVLLNRNSIAKFAGSFARPPSGMAPIPKTKIEEYFPLFSPDWREKDLPVLS